MPSPDKPTVGVNTPHAGFHAAFATGANERTGSRGKGGLTQVGAQTLYTALSTGRTYDASGTPPYPCSKCGLMLCHGKGALRPHNLPLGHQAPSPLPRPTMGCRGRMGSPTGTAPAVSYATVGAIDGGGTADDLRFLLAGSLGRHCGQ